MSDLKANNAYTPGPWNWIEFGPSKDGHEHPGPVGLVTLNDCIDVMLATGDGDRVWLEFAKPADRVLIGAAPEILEALRAAQELIDTLDDRSFDELKSDRDLKFDPYDAPDDCETIITVTRGEFRKARKIIDAAIAKADGYAR
jgi:hypothetical protein